VLLHGELIARLLLTVARCPPFAAAVFAAVSAAHFLRDNEAGSLSPPQHLALLSQLLDDCLDTSLIRDMLSNRCGGI
jgi:hypothetical protein